MRIKIRANDFRFFLPLPLGLLGLALRLIPARVFEEMRRNTPAPYQGLVARESIRLLVGECLDVLKEYKGLEILHVEAQDGTFVSVRL